MTDARPVVRVFRSPGHLAVEAAEHFAARAGEAIAARGRFLVALSGGNTPRQLYLRLAAEPYARAIDWRRVEVFWTDERAVPHDDPASNYRMARETLLDRVQLEPERIHRIRGETDPEAAAAAYERELRATFATPTGPPRAEPGARFDLALLGVGDDGHTASLFPGRDSIRERERWVIADRVAATPPERITLTPPVLAAAAELVFLVAGRSKAAALRRVLQEPPGSEPVPAQVVARLGERVEWLVDAEAAAGLDPHPGPQRGMVEP